MAKKTSDESRKIFLGDWLDLFGLGPTEAAKVAGCSQSYISNIIGGRKTNINALYLLKIAEHLDLCVNDFYRLPPTEAQITAIDKYSPQTTAALLKLARKKA